MRDNELQNIDEIVGKYADMVYRIAVTQMKNTQDAQDIFQEVFMRLLEHLGEMESEEHLKAWLIRVTLNCSKSSLTSAWRRHTQPLEEQEEIPVFEKQEQSELYEYLKALPQKYRTVLYLFYYEELSVKKICDITNQKEATIKSQLSRGRAMLKDKLETERSV